MTDEEISALIRKFRGEFGCGVLEAKKVLTVAEYDYDKACKIYRLKDWEIGKLIDYV